MNKEFIQQFDVVHQDFDWNNPLTVGNGNFAFTCDCTGLQTFYDKYQTIPLCTMTNLIWAKQKGTGRLPYQTYQKRSTKEEVEYLTATSLDTYSNYRDDWFKFDLFKLRFLYSNEPLELEKVSHIHQRLSLVEGIIYTEFMYLNEMVFVKTKIPQKHNNIQIEVQTTLVHLQLEIFCFKPSSAMCGSTLENQEIRCLKNQFCIENEYASYTLYLKTNMEQHQTVFEIKESSSFVLSLEEDFLDDTEMEKYFLDAKNIDTQDEELNRRMVLSLYLMKVNTLGMYPPAETGLTCNSWYGKFHLEMHLWHHLGLVRFGLYSYVLPSLRWYLTILNSSKDRAHQQGYQGIRFPKMTDPRGKDTPSNIGCLLIWQMPHLFIFIDEILKQDKQAISFTEYLPLLMGLTDFMSDFFYKKDGKYYLDSPLIPANENVEYSCDTPIFEECYLLHAFEIFLRWSKEYGFDYDFTKIQDILSNYAPLEIQKNCYEAYIGCKNTYTAYNRDHPMMVGMYSYFESSIVDSKMIQNTLDKILKCWSFNETWGWDFPMLAMTANRLGNKELAIEILKMKALKNGYIKNGHNPQLPKTTLPLYLPGNGAFLLAITQLFEVKNNESK